MMSELRWALLILGVLFILALTFWERRRPRQASGAFERVPLREGAAESPPRRVREPPLTLPEMRAREPVGAGELPVVETSGEPGVPVPEPAAAELAATEIEADPDAPQSFAPAPLEEDGAGEIEVAAETLYAGQSETAGDPAPLAISGARSAAADEHLAEARRAAAALRAALPETLPELPTAQPPVVEWPAENERHILALRLVAPQRERFAGRSLRQALAAEGFLLGQFAIFHKPDDERRAVLSAASLTRPGTFDIETMDSQHYGGLSLFAVLPGPMPPRQAFDQLVFAARNLNERLHGVLQDEHGTPLTPARIAQLREQLRAGAGS
jgi:cell division protein ZipA